MQSTPRTSGIRLPWSSAGANTDASANVADAPVADAPVAEQAETEGQTDHADQSEQDEQHVPSTPPEQMSQMPDFLADLVEAMRSVVEASRDRALTDLRTAAESFAEGADASTVERQAQLRSRADADVASIGDWERGEIDRVRTEATGKVAARRQLLDQEVGEQEARREAERAALQAQVTDYERRLGAFMDELLVIKDPAAFAAAARRMPSPPSVTGAGPSVAPRPVTPPPAAPAPDAPAMPPPAVGEAAASAPDAPPAAAARLAELDVQLAEEPAVESLTADLIGAATEAAEAPAAATSSVLVRGLGSFGAITAFKQALQRLDGITNVALGIGSTGEFIFTLEHTVGFDMAGAVRSIEPDAEIQADGSTVNVKVTRAR